MKKTVQRLDARLTRKWEKCLGCCCVCRVGGWLTNMASVWIKAGMLQMCPSSQRQQDYFRD